MGFNKIFLSKKNLITRYDNGGALSVFEYISKYDAILSTDELSQQLIPHISLPKADLLQKIDELLTNN